MQNAPRPSVQLVLRPYTPVLAGNACCALDPFLATWRRKWPAPQWSPSLEVYLKYILHVYACTLTHHIRLARAESCLCPTPDRTLGQHIPLAMSSNAGCPRTLLLDLVTYQGCHEPAQKTVLLCRAHVQQANLRPEQNSDAK